MYCCDYYFGPSSREEKNCGKTDGKKQFRVEADDLYRPDIGYGFVTEKNRREQELLRLPELNSGFEPYAWYADENLTEIMEGSMGCFVSSEGIPLCFKCDVPDEGNYLVKITVFAPEPEKNVLIFSERRRLAFRGDLPEGLSEKSVIVNVCDIIPNERTERFTDRTLDIAVAADKLELVKITVSKISCPVIYIAGDSTVADQSAEYPYSPEACYAGWGQMLGAYLDCIEETGRRIAVSNHAHSGRTTESFRQEGHYAIIEEYVRPKDYVFFQFGHNDQKLMNLKAHEGYQENLERFITQCRDLGACPVLVTPLARNSWRGDDGTYNDFLEEYSKVCLETGQRMKVPVLDLHRRSMEFIQEKGLEASKPYFHPDDFTHTNDCGAYLVAGFIADEIVRVCKKQKTADSDGTAQSEEWPEYSFLADCITGGFGEWHPAGKAKLPPKPEGYKDQNDLIVDELLPENIDGPDKKAAREDIVSMVIKTMRYFQTNVVRNNYADAGSSKSCAGAVECAYQNGIIDPHLVTDGYFYPGRQVTLEEALVLVMNGYRSRKHFPEEKPCSYDDKCAAYALPYVRAACALGLLAEDGSDDLQHVMTKREAAGLCRGAFEKSLSEYLCFAKDTDM